MGLMDPETEPGGYASVIQTLKDRRNTVPNPMIARAEKALHDAEIRCFHWELAFPEVFLAKDSALGFDVIIGNPPYDVLSEKEAGPRMAWLQTFVSHDENLVPSRVGKNNLYKLFICRAMELVREGGIISFIVPMPLLGDEQARGVRQLLLQAGAFAEIHAFPQKDDPSSLSDSRPVEGLSLLPSPRKHDRSRVSKIADAYEGNSFV